jgi:Tol biopolymer transport system component
MRRRIALLTIAALAVLGPTAVGGSATAGTPVVSGKIAFYRDGTGVLTVDPDGSHERQLGADLVLPGTGAWSPDGGKLLVLEFLKDEGARPATINPDGSDLTLLDAYPDLEQHLGCAFWSPDSTQFLCLTAEDVKPVNGLYTLRSSDGGGLKRLTTSPQADTCSSKHGACIEDIPLGYSAEGSQVLFNRQKRSTHSGHLCVVDSDGSGLMRLSPPELRIHDSDPGGPPASWSPDGSRVTFIAFNKTDPRHRTALYVVNADSTGLRRITPLALAATFSARWSPDGRWIAFSTAFGHSRFGDGSQIWIVHPNGSHLRELTYPLHGDISSGPVWSPDSRKLVFQSFHPEVGHGDLWTVNIGGAGLFQLTNTTAFENTPSWGTVPAG